MRREQKWALRIVSTNNDSIEFLFFHFNSILCICIFMDPFRLGTICSVQERQHSEPNACDHPVQAANRTQRLEHMAKQQMPDNW